MSIWTKKQALRTSWTEIEVRCGKQATRYLVDDRDDEAATLLAQAGLTVDDVIAMERMGLFKGMWSEAEPRHSQEQPAGTQDTGGLRANLWDGADTSDTSLRHAVEQKARGEYAADPRFGPRFAERLVAFWPTMPDTDNADGVVPYVEFVDPRPGESHFPLTGRLDIPGLKQDGINHGDGDLVAIDEVARVVTYAHLDPAVARLRSALAIATNEDETLVEIAAHLDDLGRVDDVIVLRAKWIDDPAKRKTTWLTRINDALPCTDGRSWRYRPIDGRNAFRLTLEKDPLNIDVPFTADVTERITPATPWRLGVDEQGRWIDIRLDQMAHGLIAGATRSGKSVCTYSLITHVLRMGPAARLLVADPNDTTIAPFEDKVAWSTTSTHPDDVTAMLEWVRAEMDRRKPLMREMRTDALREFNDDLPLIVVIIDEAANYLRHNDKNAAAALRGELLAVVSQGAKYGIRLILITQRPDSSILDTATRAQLSFRISFRLEDKETVVMAFPDFTDPTVLLNCQPGVGWMREVGEGARRFRSVYLSDHWGVADALPYAQPKINLTEASQPVPAPGAAPTVPIDLSDWEPPAVVQDLGEISLSLDDLEEI